MLLREKHFKPVFLGLYHLGANRRANRLLVTLAAAILAKNNARAKVFWPPPHELKLGVVACFSSVHMHVMHLHCHCSYHNLFITWRRTFNRILTIRKTSTQNFSSVSLETNIFWTRLGWSCCLTRKEKKTISNKVDAAFVLMCLYSAFSSAFSQSMPQARIFFFFPLKEKQISALTPAGEEDPLILWNQFSVSPQRFAYSLRGLSVQNQPSFIC